MSRRLLAAVLLVTMTVGFVLRWHLAGGPAPVGGFLRWRQVHSHLGYYAVLFPLLWGAWRRAGARVPGPRVLLAYVIAVAVAIGGFLRAGGYGPEAMAGSTVVLAVWLRDAWRNRDRVLAGRDWLATAPVAIPVAAACVPAVAVLQGRDPVLARATLHGFLALLLLGAVTPGALASLRVPAPPAAVWTVAALLAAAWLGPLPNPVTAAGVLLLAALLLRAVARARLPLDRRLGWGAAAAGLAAMGAGLLPNHGPIGVGAVHFLVLGPLLDALGDARWPASTVQRWATLGSAAGMAAALVAQGFGQPTAEVAAWWGTLALAAWAWRLLAPAGARRTAPDGIAVAA